MEDKVNRTVKGDKGNICHEFGMEYLDMAQRLIELLEEMSIKYDVDKEEIQVGISEVPPSAPECLVYIRFLSVGYIEYFRKNKSPNGRWVNRSNLFVKKGSSRQKGRCDLRKGIIYR